MTSALPPQLLKLFKARPPLRYLEEPLRRREQRPSGVGEYLSHFDAGGDDAYTKTETAQERINRLRRQKREAHEAARRRQLEEYNPRHSGDPYSTLFVGRLHYDADEEELQGVFARYGVVERVRVVRDSAGNSKGYAFVVFGRERDMRDVLGSTIEIRGREVLLDVERGRTVKGWLPMRLGGGLGGRARRGAPQPVRHSSHHSQHVRHPPYHSQHFRDSSHHSDHVRHSAQDSHHVRHSAQDSHDARRSAHSSHHVRQSSPQHDRRPQFRKWNERRPEPSGGYERRPEPSGGYERPPHNHHDRSHHTYSRPDTFRPARGTVTDTSREPDRPSIKPTAPWLQQDTQELDPRAAKRRRY
ncbi:hypothetical protein PYCC9005_004598 [Savitreella phatthalungensis]